ncbi:PTS system galactose-specific transporter subunit IIB [Streptococcus pneumoniae]|nr:PTS system galactose-specific transporter subunit IIB [Streptococcus pneumoniae]
MLEEREIVTLTYREALITREKSFPTGLDMEFLGKDLPNVAIPHTDIVHNLAEKVVVVRLEKPVTFHNMIAPGKEVEVSLLFFIINNSSHQIKSALEEELSNRGYDVHCDAVMVKDVNEDLMKGYDIFTPIAATDLGFEPGIPVIEAGPILFCIPAMSVPVFDNIRLPAKQNMV